MSNPMGEQNLINYSIISPTSIYHKKDEDKHRSLKKSFISQKKKHQKRKTWQVQDAYIASDESEE